MPKPMTIIWYSIFNRREGMAIDAPCCASKYETDYAIGLLSPHYPVPTVMQINPLIFNHILKVSGIFDWLMRSQ